MTTLSQPRPSRTAQKAQLSYKLYLLENARNKLEQELRDFTNQTYEEVHGVLNSSFSTSGFKVVTKALDIKCNEIAKLSAFIKDHKADRQSFDGVSFNYFQPLKATLSHQQIKVSLHSLWPLVQQHGSKSSSFDSTALTASSSFLKPKEMAVFKDKTKEVSMHVPPDIIQSNVITEEKSKPLLPPLQDAFSEMTQCNPKSQCTQPRPENNLGHSDGLAANNVNIPEFEIRKFEETEVVVSHVVSPSNFYIQHADSTKKLEALFTDLKVSHLHAEQNCIPDIGAQVICWLPQNEHWCRAQVAKISGVSRYNNAKDGPWRESSINMEALQVSLAHVTPINGRDWTEEAVGWFKAMVHDRTLYARFYPQGPTVTVELFLEKGKLGAMRYFMINHSVINALKK
ncbi:hypothetical protein ATANTOWER_022993 [Ataeniobius toweri]|uniref:Tudor domain-containing protein n=1 Tax=Ataeniobius toweri TaxID=208326 RepID=A0ABU7BK83_9TELE|nr:hypothetical protein [Ataeniobius toweri]